MNLVIRSDLYALWKKCAKESGFLFIIYFLSCDNFSVHYKYFIRSFDICALVFLQHSILARSFDVLFIYIYYENYHKNFLLHAFSIYYASESDF